MWYHTMRPEDTDDDGSNILYATSADGLTWDKPNLYISSWHGSNANNMVFDRPTVSGLTSVMHTPFDPDPNRQYRLFNYEPGAYYGAWSPDGVHTTDLPNNPIITGVGDVGMASWDPHTQQYLAYVKVNTYVNGLKRRSVALCRSSDFETWTAPELVLEPDTVDDRWVPAGTIQCTHLYGLCTFPTRSMYMGILWIFRATDDLGYTIGPGLRGDREQPRRRALDARGGQSAGRAGFGGRGAWDDGQLYTAIARCWGLGRDGKLAVTTARCDDVHGTASKRLNCNIGLATPPQGRLRLAGRGRHDGSVTTKDLYGLSGQLHVNYRGNGGWLKVELLEAPTANVLPVTARRIASPWWATAPTTWWAGTAGSELPSGTSPLRLRFVMQNASSTRSNRRPR